MYRIETKVGWAVALTIAALAIAVPQLAYGFAATAPLQEEEEEIDVTTSGNRLVFDVKSSSRSFEAHPDGTFVHASSGASLSFDEGELREFKGTDKERPTKVERVEERGGKISIRIDNGGRGLISPNYALLEDGDWVNERAGTSFVVEEGSIIKCRGFEPKS